MYLFPHIARPVICIKHIQHIAVGFADIALQFSIALHDKGFDEQRNVLFSLAQRRDGNIHNTEPIEQIAAQLVFFHCLIRRNKSAALDLKQSDAEILRYLILSLDENGFLTESASESARILQVSEQQVQSNIVLLQSMEPAGIGAANLSDCLVLQLQRMTPANPVAVQIAASFLDQLAKQQTRTIAKALGVTRAEVHEACELIRTLNSRPMNGSGLAAITGAYRRRAGRCRLQRSTARGDSVAGRRANRAAHCCQISAEAWHSNLSPAKRTQARIKRKSADRICLRLACIFFAVTYQNTRNAYNPLNF